MDFSIATLLASFTRDKSLTPKLLEQKLSLEDGIEKQHLGIALKALETIGIVEKERGRYRLALPPQEELFEAKLRCSSKGFCFAIQDDDDTEDVYIRETHLSNAWNGDRVLVKVIKEGMGRNRRRSPEGEVCLVLERSNRSVLARVKKVEDGEFRAVPLDDRLLFEIALAPTEDIKLEEIENYLVSVEIERYPLGRLLPKGRINKVLGVDAQSARDVDIVTCKYGLSETFSAAALEAAEKLPTLKKTLKAAEVKGRLDVRSLPTVAIVTGDGDESVPICDHAITLETNGNGHTRLGLHMPDLAHYIPLGSPLDRDAQRRGLAAYLSKTVLPLFPPEISTTHGSLVPGQDRLGISVLLTLDDAGQRISFEIQPSVVRSDVVLTNDQINALLENAKPPSDIPKGKTVQALVKQIQTVASALKEQRHGRGGFELRRGSEMGSTLQREGVPGVPILPQENPQPGEGVTHEVMIAANQAIAEHLHALGVPALYRCQTVPPLSDVQDAIKLASNVGLTYTLEDDAEVSPKAYQACLEELAGPNSNSKILNTLLLPTLKPCYYSVTPRPHFGLALPMYTTANAPTRHYADFLIQQILTLVFEKGRDRRTTRSKKSVNLRDSSSHGNIDWNVLPPDIHQDMEARLAATLTNLGDRERAIQDAEADIIGLQRTATMQTRIGESFTGLIVGVQSYGFFVEIEDLQIEGLVHVSSLKDDWYEYRSRQQMLVGRKNRQRYALGNPVKVEVRGVDYYRQQIDLAALPEDADESDTSNTDDTKAATEDSTVPDDSAADDSSPADETSIEATAAEESLAPDETATPTDEPESTD